MSRPGHSPSLRERARKRIGAAVVEGFFNGTTRIARFHPRAKPEAHGLEVIRDVPYASSSDTAHLLDVYRSANPLQNKPNGERPAALLYLHGGGFRFLSKDTHWIMGLAFARRGYVVFNASYRLAPEHPYPAAIEDACRAYAWVAENAAKYGADASRLVVCGESAGANLAAAVTLCACYERDEPYAQDVWRTGIVPRAVVPACGMFQVTDTARFRRRKPSMSRFIGDRLEEVEGDYVLASTENVSRDLADPLLVLERGEKPARPLPPFFMPVGTWDPLLDDTRRLQAALTKLGVTAEARYYPRGMHAFHAFVFLPEARRVWRDTYAFLDEHAPA